MNLRCFGFSSALVLIGFVPCLARQASGPDTLEPPTAQTPASTPPTGAAAGVPKRPAGTAVRPQGGIQHPDLDKAWADYEAAIAKTSGGIKAAIDKQFDTVTAKGDLDAAEKWDAIRRNFETRGSIPDETETKAAVEAAQKSLASSRRELHEAYTELTKTLTQARKLVEAREVANEGRAIAGDAQPAVAKPDPVVGKWRWSVNGKELPGAEFEPEGKIAGRPDSSWLLVDPRARRYQFMWGREFIDVMTLSADGTRLEGKNNKGDTITARRSR